MIGAAFMISSGMTIALPSAAADFDHPIEILDGCHQRIRRHCALIVKIAAHVAVAGADAEAREAAFSVLRFFETAAANHHRDEEEDLFPALHHLAPDLNAARDLMHRLRADHVRLAALWADMRARLNAVRQGDATRLAQATAAAFAAAHESHMALEESQLLPLARRALDASTVARLGRRMARRRGVAPPARASA